MGKIACFPFILPTSQASSVIDLKCCLNQALVANFSGVINSVSVSLNFHFFINNFMRWSDAKTFVTNLESGPIYK